MLDGGTVLAQFADDDRCTAPRGVSEAARPKARANGMPAAASRQRASHRKARAVFLDALTETGDPGQSARQAGLPLLQLYRHRDADPAFAADWQAALGYAWEQVETRVLAALLQRLQQEVAEPAVGAKSGFLDSRLVLAIVTGREKSVTRAGMRPVDGPAVARLRAELRALAVRQSRAS